MEGTPRSRRSGGENPYEQFALRASNSQSSVQFVVGRRINVNTSSNFKKAAPVKEEDENPLFEFDPELQMAFKKNLKFLRRVFSIETLLSPFPPQIGQTMARNLSFFTRIFTQFFDQGGIEDAQRSLGIRNDQPQKRKIHR